MSGSIELKGTLLYVLKNSSASLWVLNLIRTMYWFGVGSLIILMYSIPSLQKKNMTSYSHKLTLKLICYFKADMNPYLSVELHLVAIFLFSNYQYFFAISITWYVSDTTDLLNAAMQWSKTFHDVLSFIGMPETQ